MIALLVVSMFACPQETAVAPTGTAPQALPIILDISGLTRVDEIAELRERIGDETLGRQDRQAAYDRWMSLRESARTAHDIAKSIDFVATGQGPSPDITVFRDQRAIAVTGTAVQHKLCREAIESMAVEGRLLSVSAKIYKVRASLVTDLLPGSPWIEITGENREGLTAAMVEGGGELLQSMSLQSFSGSLAEICAYDRVPYIADYKVMASGNGQIADPVIEVVDSGTFLDVVGVVLDDRIRMRAKQRYTELETPIPTEEVVVTTTGSTVTIQKPVVHSIEVESTFDVGPQGGIVALAAAEPRPEKDGGTGQAIVVILEVSLVEDEPNPKGNR